MADQKAGKEYPRWVTSLVEKGQSNGYQFDSEVVYNMDHPGADKVKWVLEYLESDPGRDTPLSYVKQLYEDLLSSFASQESPQYLSEYNGPEYENHVREQEYISLLDYMAHQFGRATPPNHRYLVEISDYLDTIPDLSPIRVWAGGASWLTTRNDLSKLPEVYRKFKTVEEVYRFGYLFNSLPIYHELNYQFFLEASSKDKTNGPPSSPEITLDDIADYVVNQVPDEWIKASYPEFNPAQKY